MRAVVETPSQHINGNTEKVWMKELVYDNKRQSGKPNRVGVD
jgi:hypothetical protein